MTIEILAEDHALLQKLIASGRFANEKEAVHESLAALVEEDAPSEAWKQELDRVIARGLEDEVAGRVRPARDFLVELRARWER